MTCTVEITLHALSQRSPAESIGKGQKLIEAARPEGAEALSPGRADCIHCPGLRASAPSQGVLLIWVPAPSSRS